jgi:biotin synthase-like enzyme
LYPGNSLFINGYLTTGGQSADEAIAMVRDIGFEVDMLPVLTPLSAT